MRLVRTNVPTWQERVTVKMSDGRLITRTDWVSEEFFPPASDAELKWFDWDDINQALTISWLVKSDNERLIEEVKHVERITLRHKDTGGDL